MNQYWDLLSQVHKDKLQSLAKKNGIPIEQVFRNLLKYLEWEMANQLDSGTFEEMLAIRQIERMVDSISRNGG